MSHRILILDHDKARSGSMRKSLESYYDITELASAREVPPVLETTHPDVIVTHIPLPDLDGVGFIRDMRTTASAPAVIVLAEPENQELAVQSLWNGAMDYHIEPLDIEHVRNSVRKAIERRQLSLENRRYQKELEDKNRQLRAAQEMMYKHAERGAKALIETELRYRELFHQANDAIFTVSCKTEQILDLNRQAQALTGYTRSELLRMKIGDLLPPDQQDHIKSLVGRLFESGAGLVEDDTFIRKDGRQIVVSISCSTVEMNGTEVVNVICRDVTKNREMESELSSYTRRLKIRFDENSKQLIASQSQLLQAEKMAALGSLVAGIAHEINTPLGSINSNNDIFGLALDRVKKFVENKSKIDEPTTQEGLDEMFSIVDDALRTNRIACNRIVQIVRSLRNFARLDEAERKKADLHEGIESTLSLVVHEFKRRIKVIKEFGSIPEIECYPNQLNQVFMNLLVNASQAIEGEGEIRIRTWQDGGSVCISISDTGAGIPPELQKKIFDPGFTTKKVGVGTGLGLAICLRIVHGHGGRIDLESQLEHGSRFTIVLPIQGAGERK